MKIKDLPSPLLRRFADECYNHGTPESLAASLESGPSYVECTSYAITPEAWRLAVSTALNELTEDLALSAVKDPLLENVLTLQSRARCTRSLQKAAHANRLVLEALEALKS